jgi:hypothetical protein
VDGREVIRPRGSERQATAFVVEHGTICETFNTFIALFIRRHVAYEWEFSIAQEYSSRIRSAGCIVKSLRKILRSLLVRLYGLIIMNKNKPKTSKFFQMMRSKINPIKAVCYFDEF